MMVDLDDIGTGFSENTQDRFQAARSVVDDELELKYPAVKGHAAVDDARQQIYIDIAAGEN